MRSTNITFFILLLLAFVGCREEVPLESAIQFYGVTINDSSSSISLTNVTENTVDISGWYVKSSIDPNYMPFLPGTTIQPRVISGWSADFFPFDLHATGISLLLFNDAGEEQDIWTP